MNKRIFKIASVCSLAMGAFFTSCGGGSTNEPSSVTPNDSLVVAEVPTEALPATAIKKDAAYGYVAYIQNEGKGEMSDINSVWITDEQGKQVRKICVSNDRNTKVFAWKTDGELCSVEDVLAADEVKIVKSRETGKVYLVVSGCPDMRNIYSYLIQIDPQSDFCMHIPASEKFEGWKEDADQLLFSTYGYHEEGGRYSVVLSFDFNGKFISKGEPIEE